MKFRNRKKTLYWPTILALGLINQRLTKPLTATHNN